MKILFLNPPYLSQQGKFSREQRSPAVTKSGTFYYPMWLCYAAGLAEKHGFTIKIIDAPARKSGADEVIAEAVAFGPSLVVVDTSTPSIQNDAEIAARLKDATNAYTVLVGTHPSALPDETLAINSAIDAVTRREYEHTILELALLIRDNKADEMGLRNVDGLSFRGEGTIVHNKDRAFFEDLDSLPFVSDVYRRHLDHRDYFYAHSRYPIVTLITGRGCPHHCVYCLYPQTFNGHKLRYRSITNIVDEIEYCLKNFPDLQEIMFEDDTLTVNKKRALALAEEIRRRGLKFRWSANSRADVDLETLAALKRAGARLFCVGIESGDQFVLDSMKKRLTVEQIRTFFENAKQAGILIHGCFLVGNPGETKDTLEKTLNLAIELQPDTAQFFPIMVYPGTEAYAWARDNGFLTTRNYKEWLTTEGLHNCVISRPGLSNHELVAFCDEARRRFYLRPSYIVHKLKQGMTDLHEFKRLMKSSLTLSRYLFSGSNKKVKNGKC